MGYIREGWFLCDVGVAPSQICVTSNVVVAMGGLTIHRDGVVSMGS